MGDESLQDRIALVVDDHDAVRRALCERIKAAFGHFDLREAGSVEDALAVLDTEKVDLVLMDVRLPGMDGISGTRVVMERSPHTAVVVISIFDDAAHRLAASRAGAKAYVPKRAIGRELIPVIENLVNGEP